MAIIIAAAIFKEIAVEIKEQGALLDLSLHKIIINNSNMQFSNSYYKKTPTSPDVYPSFFWSQYLIFIKSEEKPRASLMHTDTAPAPGLSDINTNFTSENRFQRTRAISGSKLNQKLIYDSGLLGY